MTSSRGERPKPNESLPSENTLPPAETLKIAQILVIDDHPIVRLGLKQLITQVPGLSVTHEVGTAKEALDVLRRSVVNLVIVDLSLSDAHGVDVIRQLRQEASWLPVLVLSIHDEALFAEQALRAGARGYVMKNEAANQLISAIRQVLDGRIFMSDRATQSLLEAIGRRRRGPHHGLEALSTRELAVLEQIGRGLSTSEIAKRLRVSAKTIETYRATIQSKLNLKGSKDLLRFGVMWTERLGV